MSEGDERDVTSNGSPSRCGCRTCCPSGSGSSPDPLFRTGIPSRSLALGLLIDHGDAGDVVQVILTAHAGTDMSATYMYILLAGYIFCACFRYLGLAKLVR